MNVFRPGIDKKVVFLERVNLNLCVRWLRERLQSSTDWYSVFVTKGQICLKRKYRNREEKADKKD